MLTPTLTDTDTMLTLPQCAQLALDVQSACNLSGVLLSFARITITLREMNLDARTHPILQLFADKVSDMTRSRDMNYGPTYDAVEALAIAGAPANPS